MSKNKQYAKQLQEMEGYERKIIAFKLCDEVPEHVEFYGDDFSFYCNRRRNLGGTQALLYNQQEHHVRWSGIHRDRKSVV